MLVAYFRHYFSIHWAGSETIKMLRIAGFTTKNITRDLPYTS